MTHQTIIVLDFGSQYTQLIARRLRELSVYSEVWPPDTPIAKIRERQPVGVILSGGPRSVSEPGAPKCDAGIYNLDVPVLGICYGMQLMADSLGGRVAPAHQREFGHATVTVTGRPGGIDSGVAKAGDPAALFAGIPDEIRVWASHGDFVAAVLHAFFRFVFRVLALVCGQRAADVNLVGREVPFFIPSNIATPARLARRRVDALALSSWSMLFSHG